MINRLLLLAKLSLCILPGSALASTPTMTLSPSEFEHITFDDIPPTKYRLEKPDTLVAEVKQSSSILLKPFAKVQSIQKVQVLWQSSGQLKLKDTSHEKKKSGDDALFRIGLILSGEAPMVPFFAPAWVKKSRDVLKLASDRMLYLVVGSPSAPGSRWESPYSSSIESLVMESKPSAEGWQAAEVSFEKPLKVVGLWLFADGDDTKSEFTSRLKDLKLH
ncbi:DUF3047 domain-containing protein [Pseudobacteriovorax antillogorgiicola]|uniref:DUF3047 domain-containing protein n=1 Tax=Pseudobacteriovorax antillogorgiicola TaxID=1513793 RepID=A0A1Y6BBD8_9BACT|nr:DUF3047 domain-containing protein [Pseudobacteriovorax antillogorgiicola]TCS58689.1 DUF3047 family protein [Pseudobacteriovorax antillogorgiicola]SME95805.1 Protein of unknown function [Pseudobacteriovorax antillogorgiicola]